MRATREGREIVMESDAIAPQAGAGPMAELTVDSEPAEGEVSFGSLPWIGALRNPRLGPMLVINDSGYLVPLCTAGDLLRGCRYLWRTSRD